MSKFLIGFGTAVLVVFALLWVLVEVTAETQPRFYIEYLEPQTEDEAAAMQILQEANIGGPLFELLENNTAICENTIIRFGAPEGPLYNPETREIWMPYSFVVDVFERFKRYEYSDDSAELIGHTVNVMEYVLIHEIGHALVHQLQIPVVGKEEDAVDTFAALLLIDAYENGGDIVMSAADSWGLMSADRPELDDRDFADEHSLDAQRFHQSLCLIYGSDPVRYRKLAENFQWDDRRVHMCVREYQQKVQAWARLLEGGETVSCEEPLIAE